MKYVLRIGGAIVAVLLIGAAGLWIASNRRDAGRMRASVEIERAPEEIWPWITEPEQLPQWVGWLAVVKPDTTSPAVTTAPLQTGNSSFTFQTAFAFAGSQAVNSPRCPPGPAYIFTFAPT